MFRGRLPGSGHLPTGSLHVFIIDEFLKINIHRDLTMLSQILFAAFAATAAASSGFLEETSNSTICDSVKQYSGYYKLTTGAK
jgi:hypothetical protein